MPRSSAGNQFKDFVKPTFDKDAMMQSHRKNLDALTEANKMAVEVMKSITQLQSQYVKQTFEDFSKMMKSMGQSGEQANHGEAVKDQLSKAMEHGSAITNTLTKSQREIMEMMHGRFSESVEELQEMQKKAAKKHH